MLRLQSPTVSLLLLLSALASPACTGGGGATASDTDPTAGSDTEPTAGGICGNGAIDGSEPCDGADLGGKACADVDPAFTGTLACAADCSFDVSGCSVDPGAPRVVFNEVTSQGALAGPFAGKGDAIELYNAGGAAADLSGWKLSDDATLPADRTYVFPPGTQLAPKAFLVLVTLDDVTGEGDFPFGISATNEETLTLATADSVASDTLIVDGAAATISYCRLPDGTGAWQACDQSFGEPNQAASMACGDGTRAGAEACDGADLGGATCQSLGFGGGALACSQTCTLDASMCTSASSVALNELESGEDRIELVNAGDAPVDISGWILTDDVVDANYDPAQDLEKLVFAPNTSLAAGQFLVVPKGMLVNQHPFGLGAAGDTVSLLRPDLTPASQVTYGPDQATLSYCRLPDGPTGAWMPDCIPTFGAANMAP